MYMQMLVEYAEKPLAIGTRKPRFSWTVPLAGRNRKQSAYQILVATAEELLQPGTADLWDSGKVESSQSVNVEYAGAELQSNMDCFWTVQIWDEKGKPVGFSPAEYFGTARFDENNWPAQWIGLGNPDEPVPDPDMIPQLMEAGDAGAAKHEGEENQLPAELASFEPDPRSPLLRKGFVVDKSVRRARAFVCGLGLFEFRLNGQKVGDAVLATPRTDFRKRVFYSTYDVTPLLTNGDNAVGLILGNGWYNGQKAYWHWQMPWVGSPRAIMQLEIEFEDGSAQLLLTDSSWQGDWSPITFNCIYDGENYDARLEQTGWDSPGFDTGAWQQVNVVPEPGGALVPLDHQPEKVMETFYPVSFREAAPGVYVYDMGRVMTGWARLKIQGGQKGETIKLRFAELQHDNGMINPATAGGARQAEHYIMKGSSEEIYEPRFTYHGFRYIELTGYPGVPNLNTLEAKFVHQGVEQSGSFECGNELINKIHRCTVQSQRCNLQMGVPTDDTQRAERLGWCGDAWSYAQEAFYNLDTARFWRKWIADFYDQQDEESGLVSFICPLPAIKEDLVWSAAFVLIPWWHYVYYGDRRILEESYPRLQKYTNFLERVGEKDIPLLAPDQVHKALVPCCENRFPSAADHGYMQRSRFGDHLAIHEGSSGFGKDHPRSIATAFYYMDAVIMARIAETLGYKEDAETYRQLAGKIKTAFNKYFFAPELGYYDVGCQSAQAWALAFGLVPEEHRGRVTSYLNSSVNFRQRRLTTGYAGTKWAIEAIGKSGRHDIVWNRAKATDYPSWGFMLRADKTTITENWHGAASQCHTTLGAAIDEWFYWGLAGIRSDENAPGFEKIVFKPYLPADLPWARASLKTPRGMIVSEWRQDEGRASLTITVPANSTAVVHIPAADPASIIESNTPAAEAPAVKLQHLTGNETVYETGSGTYRFTFPRT